MTFRFSGVADAQFRPDAREYVAGHGCVRALTIAVVAATVAVGDSSGPSASQAASLAEASSSSSVRTWSYGRTGVCGRPGLPRLPDRCKHRVGGRAARAVLVLYQEQNHGRALRLEACEYLESVRDSLGCELPELVNRPHMTPGTVTPLVLVANIGPSTGEGQRAALLRSRSDLCTSYRSSCGGCPGTPAYPPGCAPGTTLPMPRKQPPLT